MKKIIITEGREDAKFFEGLLSSIVIRDVEVLPMSHRGNKEQILNINKLQAKLNSFGIGGAEAKILIVCDADYVGQAETLGGFDETKTASTSLLRQLKENGENLGKEVEIFIIPNNQNDGNLESLFLDAASLGIEAFNCADSYLKCLGRDIPADKNLKIKSRVLLAALGAKDDVFQIGYAAFDDKLKKHRDGYWDFKSSALNPLASFLQKYFN